MEITFSLIVKLVTLWVMAVTSLLGNSYLVYTFLSEHEMQVAANTFIVSQSVADFSQTLLIVPITAISLICDKWVLGRTVCNMEPYVSVFLQFAAISSAATIALDRYVAIVKADHYKTFAKHRLKYVLLIWFAAFLNTAIALQPWSVNMQRGYADEFYMCLITVQPLSGASEIASFFFAWTLGGFLPIGFTMYAFFSIFRFVWRVRHQTIPAHLSNSTRLAMETYSHSAHSSLTIIVLCAVTTSPTCIYMTLTLMKSIEASRETAVAFEWLKWFGCVAKPLVCFAKRKGWIQFVSKKIVALFQQHNQQHDRNIDYIVEVAELSPEARGGRPDGVPVVSCNNWVNSEERLHINCYGTRPALAPESQIELKFLDISKVPLSEDETDIK